MARKKKDDPRKKSEHIQLKLDPQLRGQVDDYIEYYEQHGQKFSISGLIRALLRWHTDPQDPRPPPPGIEEESKRPSRRRDED